MDIAYHIKTKKNVSALEIDDLFEEPNKEEFIIPELNDISNYKEVLKNNNLENIKVSYVKSYGRIVNDKKQDVRPFFKIINKEKLGIETLESELHKRLKTFVYNYIYKNGIDLFYSIDKDMNKFIIDKNTFSYIDEEVTIFEKENFKRADVLVKFKEEHPILGYGVVIEIQLSIQTDEKKEERTLDRALKGYSTIWFEKDDFLIIDSHILLINDYNYIEPYLNILKKFKNDFFQRFNEEKNNISDLLYKNNDLIKNISKDFEKKQQELEILCSHNNQKLFELETKTANINSKINNSKNEIGELKYLFDESNKNINLLKEMKYEETIKLFEKINNTSKNLETYKEILNSEKLKDFDKFTTSLKKYDEMFYNYSQSLFNFNNSLATRVKNYVQEEIKK